MLEPALPSLDARTSLTLSTPDARTLAQCSNQPYPLDASLDARNRALDISSALLIRVRVPASSSNRNVALNLYRTCHGFNTSLIFFTRCGIIIRLELPSTKHLISCELLECWRQEIKNSCSRIDIC